MLNGQASQVLLHNGQALKLNQLQQRQSLLSNLLCTRTMAMAVSKVHIGNNSRLNSITMVNLLNLFQLYLRLLLNLMGSILTSRNPLSDTLNRTLRQPSLRRLNLLPNSSLDLLKVLNSSSRSNNHSSTNIRDHKRIIMLSMRPPIKCRLQKGSASIILINPILLLSPVFNPLRLPPCNPPMLLTHQIGLIA